MLQHPAKSIAYNGATYTLAERVPERDINFTMLESAFYNVDVLARVLSQAADRISDFGGQLSMQDEQQLNAQAQAAAKAWEELKSVLAQVLQEEGDRVGEYDDLATVRERVKTYSSRTADESGLHSDREVADIGLGAQQLLDYLFDAAEGWNVQKDIDNVGRAVERVLQADRFSAWKDKLSGLMSHAMSTLNAFKSTLKNLAEGTSDTEYYKVGSADQTHPKFIRIQGQLFKLEEEEPQQPEYIKVGGVVFQKVPAELIEAAKKKSKSKKKDDDKDEKKGKGKKKSKKDDKKGKPAKEDKKKKKVKSKDKKEKAKPGKSKGKWADLPKGWTKKSAESFWNSIGGSVTECRKKLKDAEEIDNTGAFCASLKDRLQGEDWRKGPKKSKKKKKASTNPPRSIRVNGKLYLLDD